MRAFVSNSLGQSGARQRSFINPSSISLNSWGLSCSSFLTPRPGIILFGQTNNQGFSAPSFAGTSCFRGLIIESPFLLFLAAIPGQQGMGLGDGHDLGQATLDSQPVFHQNAPVGLGQGHPDTQLAA